MPFSFQNVAHAFSSVFHDAHVALKAVEGAIPAVQKAEPVVEGVTQMLVPGTYGAEAVVIERAAFSSLGLLASAVHDLDAAGVAKGANVQLDQQTVTDIKALISQYATQFKAAGIKL